MAISTFHCPTSCNDSYCLNFASFCEFLKSGDRRTDLTMWKYWSRLGVPVGLPRGSISPANLVMTNKISFSGVVERFYFTDVRTPVRNYMTFYALYLNLWARKYLKYRTCDNCFATSINALKMSLLVVKILKTFFFKAFFLSVSFLLLLLTQCVKRGTFSLEILLLYFCWQYV